MPRAWIYTVDEDAMLGDHMITVSTTATNADDEDIDDVTLTVSVAGPPTHDLAIGGGDTIPLGGSQRLHGHRHRHVEQRHPALIDAPVEDRNDKVTVSVQPTDALVVEQTMPVR